jgi:uncharacterized protein (DUF2252 family)
VVLVVRVAVDSATAAREETVSDEETFEKALDRLINRYCRENASNTPDFILAHYMKACLDAFDQAVQQRETWYGRDARPELPVVE